MATLTSLYLCSRTVYAAVGSPTANGARITAAAQTELPEGCLINGVITNEADLAAALKEFFAANKLPTNHVALMAGGTQFMHRIVTLPAMSEKKRLAVLARELSTGGAETKAPLDDYMLLAHDGKGDTVLATRVEQAVIAGYDALAKAAGFKLYSIDLGLAALIKAVRTVPALQKETFVLLQFDDDTISAALFEQGQYTYSTRHRDRAEALRHFAVPYRRQERTPHPHRLLRRRGRAGHPRLHPRLRGTGAAGRAVPGFAHRPPAGRRPPVRRAVCGGQPDRALIYLL